MPGLTDKADSTKRYDQLWMGLDVGSTTVKVVVIDGDSDTILWADYQRHETKQPEKAIEMLKAIAADFPNTPVENIRVFITGSGGSGIAKHIGAKFVQEVNAVSLAVEKLYPACGSVIATAPLISPRASTDLKMLAASDGAPSADPAGTTSAGLPTNTDRSRTRANRARSLDRSPREIACRRFWRLSAVADATAAATPWPDGFPGDWPFPARTTAYNVEDRGAEALRHLHRADVA